MASASITSVLPPRAGPHHVQGKIELSGANQQGSNNIRKSRKSRRGGSRSLSPSSASLSTSSSPKITRRKSASSSSTKSSSMSYGSIPPPPPPPPQEPAIVSPPSDHDDDDDSNFRQEMKISVDASDASVVETIADLSQAFAVASNGRSISTSKKIKKARRQGGKRSFVGDDQQQASPRSTTRPKSPSTKHTNSSGGGRGPSTNRPPLFRAKSEGGFSSSNSRTPQQEERAMFTLAEDCVKRGDLLKAIALYEHFLKEQQKMEAQYGFIPNDHIKSSTEVSCRLADVYMLSSNYEKAAELLEQTQERIHSRSSSPTYSSFDLGTVCAKLGNCRLQLGDCSGAHRAFRGALRVARSNMGGEHPSVANLLSQIACVYFQCKEYMAAEAGFEDAYDIYRLLAGRDADRDTWMAAMAESLCNIGSVQTARKQFTKANASFSEALSIQRGLFGWGHPLVTATLDNLAFTHTKRKEYGKARETYREMLRAQLYYYKTYTPQCFDTLKKVNIVFEKEGDLRGALAFTQEEYRVQRQMLPSDHEVPLKTTEILNRLSVQVYHQLQTKDKQRQ